jgi:hypothetical protein
MKNKPIVNVSKDEISLKAHNRRIIGRREEGCWAFAFIKFVGKLSDEEREAYMKEGIKIQRSCIAIQTLFIRPETLLFFIGMINFHDTRFPWMEDKIDEVERGINKPTHHADTGTEGS